jgi:hypothetical protein
MKANDVFEAGKAIGTTLLLLAIAISLIYLILKP